MEKIITIKNLEGFTLATLIVRWDSDNYEVEVLYSSDKSVELEIQELKRS